MREGWGARSGPDFPALPSLRRVAESRKSHPSTGSESIADPPKRKNHREIAIFRRLGSARGNREKSGLYGCFSAAVSKPARSCRLLAGSRFRRACGLASAVGGAVPVDGIRSLATPKAHQATAVRACPLII